MKMKSILILAIASVALPGSTVLAADNRFDGIWVGKEEVQGQEFRGGSRVTSAVTKPAEIAIAQGGALLAVVDGFGPGRYMDIQRVGNSIVFQAGQRLGQLTLSPDGQTLLEKGVVPGFMMTNIYQREGALSGHTRITPVKGAAEITGTFRRQK